MESRCFIVSDNLKDWKKFRGSVEKAGMVCRCSLSEFSLPSDSNTLQKKRAKEGWKAWTNEASQFSSDKYDLNFQDMVHGVIPVDIKHKRL